MAAVMARSVLGLPVETRWRSVLIMAELLTKALPSSDEIHRPAANGSKGPSDDAKGEDREDIDRQVVPAAATGVFEELVPNENQARQKSEHEAFARRSLLHRSFVD